MANPKIIKTIAIGNDRFPKSGNPYIIRKDGNISIPKPKRSKAPPKKPIMTPFNIRTKPMSPHQRTLKPN